MKKEKQTWFLATTREVCAAATLQALLSSRQRGRSTGRFLGPGSKVLPKSLWECQQIPWRAKRRASVPGRAGWRHLWTMRRISCCPRRSLPVNPVNPGCWAPSAHRTRLRRLVQRSSQHSISELGKSRARGFLLPSHTLYPVCGEPLADSWTCAAVWVEKKRKKWWRVRENQGNLLKKCLCYLINLWQQIIYAKLGLAKSPKNNFFFVRF